MRWLIVFLSFVSCSCHNEAGQDTRNTPEGKWQVVMRTETDYAIEGHEWLKGPFTDTVKNESVEFTADSIFYHQPGLTSRYEYRKQTDSVLTVMNADSKAVMTIRIHYLSADSLSYTNIRSDEHRGNQYEVRVDCKK